MYVTNYDYNGRSGEFYNELYTYDKTWNESSWVPADGLDGGNEQLPTGINTNNYFIQKYGADFLPYRSMGWMNDRWRRPNAKRNGGIQIGITASAGSSGSSPMDYTNGSHTRYLYLGNKFCSLCMHCTTYVGLPTGKAVFVGPNGTTFEYEIDYWDDVSGGREGTKTEDWIGWIDQNGNTGGPGRTGSWGDQNILWGSGGGGVGGAGGDGLVFKLKTDPADDGIPALKTCAVIEPTEETISLSYLVVTGLGVMIPFYYKYEGGNTGRIRDPSYSYGGNLSGDNSIIWSGDSGTSVYVYDTKTESWVPTDQAFSSAWAFNYVPLLKTITGDEGYSLITIEGQPYVQPEYRNEQGGAVGYTAGVTTGITFGNRVIYSTVTANVKATGAYPDSPLQNVISATASIQLDAYGADAIAPTYSSTVFYTNDRYQSPGFTLQVPYDAENCSMTLSPIENNNSGTYPAGFLAKFISSNGTIVGGDGGHLAQQVYSDLVPLIGQTGDMEVTYYNDVGSLTRSYQWYVNGFNSGTGSFSYDTATNRGNFNITGTAVDEGVTYETSWALYYTDPTEIIVNGYKTGPNDNTGFTFTDITSLPAPAGRTVGYILSCQSRWSINDKLGGSLVDKYVTPSGFFYVNGGRTVDRSPFFLVNFSAFSSDRDSYGVAGGTSGSRSDWLHTPAAGNISGQGNSAENGRLYFVQKQIIEQALNGRTFDRIMIGNPAGYVAGDIQGNADQRQGYYPNNAGTGMLIDEARSYASSVTNPSIGGSTGIGILQTYATPFTPTGTPGETRGDQVAAWKVATDALRSANVKEVFCYIGYGQAYETSSKNTIDDNILGYSPGWSRSDVKPTVYPRDEWERQWNILRQCGFDNAVFDAGTYAAKYDDEPNYKDGNSRINVISDVIGNDNQQFEAIPRDADGGMKTTNTGSKWDYTKTKSWAYWPILGGIEIGGELYGRRNAGTSGIINFTDWSLDPLTTEVHIVLDLYKLMNEGWINNSSTDVDNPNGRVIVWSEFKALVEALKSKGLIVSGSSWSANNIVNDEEIGVKTPDDIVDYILSSQSG